MRKIRFMVAKSSKKIISFYFFQQKKCFVYVFLDIHKNKRIILVFITNSMNFDNKFMNPIFIPLQTFSNSLFQHRIFFTLSCDFAWFGSSGFWFPQTTCFQQLNSLIWEQTLLPFKLYQIFSKFAPSQQSYTSLINSSD